MDYLRTNIVGAATHRMVAVGDEESAVLAAYPRDLLYLPWDATETWRICSGEEEPVYNEPEIDCDYVLVWQPDGEGADSRDITFYIKDKTVAVIELTAPYERRYGYGLDRDLSDRMIAEKRAALGE